MDLYAEVLDPKFEVGSQTRGGGAETWLDTLNLTPGKTILAFNYTAPNK